LAVDLLESDDLYPQLDPGYENGAATAPWGTYADEDILEWGRLVFELVEAIHEGVEALDQGETITYNHLGRPFAEVTKDEEMISVRLRRNLVYESAPERDRRLSDPVLQDIFAQVTNDALEGEDYEWETYPHDAYWATVHFFGAVATPEEWLAQRSAEVGDKKGLRLPGQDVGW
jgi:hypothetical protein